MSQAADVEAAVRTLLGTNRIVLDEVVREPIAYDAFLAGRTLARLRGTARVNVQQVEWSFIEKDTDGPATASAYLYDNGLREVTAYRSGLLADLARGVRAPRLLAADVVEDGALRLWIEDVATAAHPVRDADEILVAAQLLGRLSGHWLGRVPASSWLFEGWIDRHRQPAALSDGRAVVEGALSDSAIDARLDGRLSEAMELIRDQDRFASALRQLPTTLCHHDAVAANVFVPDAADEIVLIDWESVGPGAVGADLASLLFASPRRGDVSARLIRDLMPEALAAYAEGLTDAGARVEPDALRLGLHASIALRWALIRDVAAVLANGGSVFRGSALDESPDEALAQLLLLVPVLLDSAAEARRLMRSG